MSEAVSVKVAVRCRPFNSREKERNATLIIDMTGNSTKITNPETKAVKVRPARPGLTTKARALARRARVPARWAGGSARAW
jgi:hypothetical protein